MQTGTQGLRELGAAEGKHGCLWKGRVRIQPGGQT